MMKREEAIQLVLDKQATAIGARTMSLMDSPSGEVYIDAFLDLSDEDYNPEMCGGDLVLELWFADYKLSDIPPDAIIESRVVKRSFESVTLHKVRVKVDLDRIYVGGHRFYIED